MASYHPSINLVLHKCGSCATHVEVSNNTKQEDAICNKCKEYGRSIAQKQQRFYLKNGGLR